MLSPWLLLFFWLIVPLIIQIARIVSASFYSIEFYDNKMVIKSGVFNKVERQSVFAGVYSVSLSQSFLGGIFDYGDVRVDCPGRWDVDTYGIKAPNSLKNYLQNYISTDGMTNLIYN